MKKNCNKSNFDRMLLHIEIRFQAVDVGIDKRDILS